MKTTDTKFQGGNSLRLRMLPTEQKCKSVNLLFSSLLLLLFIGITSQILNNFSLNQTGEEFFIFTNKVADLTCKL